MHAALNKRHQVPSHTLVDLTITSGEKYNKSDKESSVIYFSEAKTGTSNLIDRK